MFNIIKRRSTHASKLERWLGPSKCAELSTLHKDWYGPPIALAGVPGAVYCRGGGDFVGNIDAGSFQNYWDYSISKTKQFIRRAAVFDRTQMATGFATLQAIIDAANTGYAQNVKISVSGAVGVANRAYDVWRSAVPVAGVEGGAAPGGTAYNKDSPKAAYIRNAGAGKTLTAVNNQIGSGVAMSYLVCDRLFAVAKTMNSTASEAVTGVATRYQSSTSTDPDWCGGNFVYPRCYTALPATAHNHTVCQYTDQDGNTGVSFPSVAGVASCARDLVDLPDFNWFMNLDAGDVGVKSITQIQLNAAVATGGIDYVLSHPLFWCPAPGLLSINGYVPSPWINNHINSAMQLTRIFNDACLYMYYPNYNGVVNSTMVNVDIVEG